MRVRCEHCGRRASTWAMLGTRVVALCWLCYKKLVGEKHDEM
jgi:hypothetical protein